MFSNTNVSFYYSLNQEPGQVFPRNGQGEMRWSGVEVGLFFVSFLFLACFFSFFFLWEGGAGGYLYVSDVRDFGLWFLFKAGFWEKGKEVSLLLDDTNKTCL